MCRWIAHLGSPVLLEDILYKPQHSLIDQSLHAKLGVNTTNGYGFGLGWYDESETPVLYKGVQPAWNDQNLRKLSQHVRSRPTFAHIRASTGTPVQETNCHPFRHRKWMWMHNGQIAGFQVLKRDLMFAIRPDLFERVLGSSDAETFFYLALTFGLEENPPAAVERAVGFIEQTGRRHGIEDVMRMSVATTDGESIWAFRYATVGEPPSLFFSTKIETLRAQYADVQTFRELSGETRLVVSEPLGERAGASNELPRSSYGVICPGEDRLEGFTPRLD